MSQVPESLLQAIQAVSFADEEAGAWRLRLPDALATVTRWWEQHRVLVLDECGPQCPAWLECTDTTLTDAATCSIWTTGQPCPVLAEREGT